MFFCLAFITKGADVGPVHGKHNRESRKLNEIHEKLKM